ncbi:unnamed protein product [Arabidopsis halleri]
MSWKVAMKSKHEKVYFERGWANFVADNALKDGEFLSFVFDGYRRYAVSIYGYGEKEINDDETKSDTDYSPDSLDTTTIFVESVQVFNKSATSRKRANTIENPEAYLDDPNNISFETVVKNRPYELLVHEQFVKDYCLKFGDNIEYIDMFGKLTARTKKWGDQRVCINKWHDICRRNKFTKNDSILCEIFRNGDNVVYAIKIHIIRDGVART